MPPRFLFIGGLARSGTTMLQDMLGQHSQIAEFAATETGRGEAWRREGQWHQKAYPQPEFCGGPGGYARTYWVPPPNPWARDHLLEAWTPHYTDEGKWAVEKSPPNILLFPFLHGCFPDSRFVFIMRHPVACAMALRKWTEDGVPRLIEHWCHLHERWRDELSKHPEVPYKVVRYEQLLTDHEAVIHALQSWLGLDREAVEYAVKDEPQANYCGEYLGRYDLIGLQHSFRTMLYNLEKRVNAFGYSLTPEALLERGGMHDKET